MTKNYNLACPIYRHYLANPEAPAVVCQGRSLSYGELAERSTRLAFFLTRSCGWQGQDRQPPRVGILASRGVDACVAMLGTCWAGGTYVPIGLKQPEQRILTVLAQCRLSAIITDDEGVKLLSERLLAACPQLIIHAGQLAATHGDSIAELGRVNTTKCFDD
jgi:D-alanine--poly(phosphoribitol) ligase subunit 1